MFVIVNKTSKLPEGWPNTSGLTTEALILQWIDDMLNNGGMGIDQELVASHEPSARPNVDEHYITITQDEAYFNEAHPVYPMIKQWRKTYNQSDVPVERKLEAIESKEAQVNETVIPTHKRVKTDTLAIYVILELLNMDTKAKIDASALGAKSKRYLKTFVEAARKVKKNDDTKRTKKALLTANPASNPDIETDWDINNFIEEQI